MSRASDGRALPSLALVVAIALVAANMRATITGVGPLLSQIADESGTTTAALGLLGSIPLLTWALVSPLAHALTTRFGMSRVVTASLVALALGTIWRSLPGWEANLWLGTTLIGASLAIGNVVMPAAIKHDFGRRVPLMMGLYTALLGGMGALASGLVVPLSQAVGTGGWRVALLATGALVPVAAVVWALATRRAPADDAGMSPRHGSRIWRDPVAWLVAGYMGAQSASFMMLLTWLASLAASAGRTPVAAGADVMVYQLAGVAGSFAVAPALRGRLRRWTPALVPIVTAVAVAGMIVAPQAITVWAVLAGLPAGASLGTALTLMAERARDTPTATALSGMSQSIGYLFAAFGPVAFGALHALTGSWTPPLLLLLAVVVAQFTVGLAVGRERFVLDR